MCPFLANFPAERFVECGGSELYLIVPLEEDACLFVNNWYIDEFNNYMGGIDPYEESVYASGDNERLMGAPILLSCNVSETMPNAVVCVVQHVNYIEYTSMLSLMDGSLYLDDNDIMDISFNRDGANLEGGGPAGMDG